jgi:uncharacterized repeat protein (TIGR03837 family)
MTLFATTPALQWDVFCRVIDNFGDIGVCWRLATQLAQRGHQVRLWVDDASALAWMAPQGCDGVELRAWGAPPPAPHEAPCDVAIEAFGCDIATEFIASQLIITVADGKKPLWINLEYLSAEAYVERCHGLPSPIMSGPGAGCTRWFFYPGFTPSTGGLLREPDYATHQQTFDRNAWRTAHGVGTHSTAVSLFCYEPPGLTALLHTLPPSAQLLVTPGRASAAVQAVLAGQQDTPSQIYYLPPCPQTAFDHMLWACDLNLVRGEDSLVRALWAGQALVWHIYPQDDNAHHAKLMAFLDWLQAPASLRQFHAVWNGLPGTIDMPALCPEILADWTACIAAARARLWQQNDLVSQLIGFVAEKR